MRHAIEVVNQARSSVDAGQRPDQVPRNGRGCYYVARRLVDTTNYVGNCKWLGRKAQGRHRVATYFASSRKEAGDGGGYWLETGFGLTSAVDVPLLQTAGELFGNKFFHPNSCISGISNRNPVCTRVAPAMVILD
jgi:hypothetical protein